MAAKKKKVICETEDRFCPLCGSVYFQDAVDVDTKVGKLPHFKCWKCKTVWQPKSYRIAK